MKPWTIGCAPGFANTHVCHKAVCENTTAQLVRGRVGRQLFVDQRPQSRPATSASGGHYPHRKCLRQMSVRMVCDLNKDSSIGRPSGCSR